MRVIIAGSRYKDKERNVPFSDYSLVLQAVDRCGYDITEVVCGMAVGVDKLGEQYANMMGIPVKEMPADWNRHGKRAGVLRNVEMALYADAAIIVWDGTSPGSRHMINEMIRKKKPYYVALTESEDVPVE